MNEFTGAYEFRNFDVRANVALADSMKNFLNNTPPGNYIGITVIFNGQTNVAFPSFAGASRVCRLHSLPDEGIAIDSRTN